MFRHAHAAAVLAFVLAACSSPGSSQGRSQGSSQGSSRASTDARVHSFFGQAPPEIAADVRWLNAQPASLAALGGRVVFVQFAFPT